MKFGEVVTQQRRARGLSQKAAASACGWSRSKQSHIETGRYDKPITAEDRARLGHALGCEFVSDDAGVWSAHAGAARSGDL